MKYKKSLLTIFLMACVLFSISSVMASDMNETAIAIEDDNQIIEETNDEIVSANAEDEILATDAGTFTALQNKINNAVAGSTITLENDYTYDEGFSTDGISISGKYTDGKSFTIDGNGHTLNGLSKSRIFTISCWNVTIKNTKFINGFTKNSDGGAIDIRSPYGSYATIENCEFNNNVDNGADGGAICCDGSYSTIKNCKFNQNYDSSRGGAIFIYGSYCSVDNCEFVNDYAISGSSIYWNGNYGTLTSCKFNTSITGFTYVVYWVGENGIISNCKLYDSTNSKEILIKSETTATNGFDIINTQNSQSSSSSSSSSSTTKVTKTTPKLTAKAATFKVKTKTKKYSVVLKTNKNKAMSKVKLYLKVNGKTYTAKTNSKGKATFKITKLKKKGTYKATITYKGSSSYNKVTKTIKIKCK